jgi:hypothetical protein
MKSFTKSKSILIELGIYKNAIATDYTNKSIYITIPYGSIKNSGKTKVYKRPTKLNFNRIQKYWFESIDKNKILNY